MTTYKEGKGRFGIGRIGATILCTKDIRNPKKNSDLR